MNIYDIANLAEVSIATVSRVLNDKPGVSAQAKEKVMAVINEHHYVPNQIAKSLANKKTNVIGLVMPGMNDYFSRRVDSINKVCKDSGYSLMVTANYKDENNIEEDIEHFDLLMEKRVDGIIYFPTHVSEEHIDLLKKIQDKIPLVVTDSEIDGVDIPCVVQDSMTPTNEIMQYLIKGGHEYIGYINGLSYDKVNNGRYAAFTTAMMVAGLEINSSLMASGDFSVKSGYDAMMEILKKKSVMPTAIIAANDNMALGAMKALFRMGIKVPDQVSIVGYDGIDYGKYSEPTLTTIEVNQNRLGTLAAQMLLQRIDNKKVKEKRVVMDYQIYYGNSTCEINGLNGEE